MSSLRDIRIDLVEQSGHYELVVDTTGWVDNGANAIIREAQAWLDLRCPPDVQHEQRVHEAVAGAYSIIENDLRFIDWIDCVDAANEGRTVLEQKSLQELRTLYPDFAGAEQGRPLYWARTASDEVVANPDLIENGTFESEDGWTLHVESGECNLAIAEGVLSISGDGYCCASIPISVSESGNYQVTFTVENSGDIEPILKNRWAWAIVARGEDPPWDAGWFVGDGDILGWQELTPGEYDFYFLAYCLGLGSLTYDNVSVTREGTTSTLPQDTILIMPPADASYTLTCFGGPWATTLTNDTDISWWSDRHPDMLVNSARRILEVRHRNASGVKEWQTILDSMLWDLQKQRVYEKTGGKHGRPQMRG